MSRLPCEQVRIQQPLPDDPRVVPYVVLPNMCCSPFCDRQADEEHHAVRRSFTRSWWTRDYALIDDQLLPIKFPLCRICHNRCTLNEAAIVWNSQWYWDHGGGYPHRLLSRYFVYERGAEHDAMLDEADVAPEPPRPSASSSIEPGATCPTCARKVPHPRKPSSPKSAVKSYRIPAEAKEDWDEMVDAAAAHLGCQKEPYATYKALLTGLVLVLQSQGEKRAA